jgi:serine/threonine-protein kinase
MAAMISPTTALTLIARGGSCDVFRFVRQDTGEPAVLKCLLDQAQNSPVMREAFAHEATLLRMLDGHRFAKIFAVIEWSGRPSMVLQSLDATPLSIASTRATRECIDITLQVLDALSNLHELSDAQGPLSAVHRDITPANVLCDNQSRCWLIDLGLSSSRLMQRAPNALVEGTAGYCAPELYTGESAIGPPTDLFATAILLWELLASQRLYPSEKFKAMSAIVDSDARLITDVRADISAPLVRLLTKALSRDAHKRFQTAGEFAEQLRALG